MKAKEFMNSEIKLKKKVLVILIAACVILLGLFITFACLMSKYKNNWLAADGAYNQSLLQTQAVQSELDTAKQEMTDKDFVLQIKDVEIEYAKKETEEQKAYVKEYQTELNDLKLQLALRGIEAGDMDALKPLGEDFAKQYEELKKKEATIEEQRAKAAEEGTTEPTQEVTEDGSGNPWVDMYDGIKEDVGQE